MDKHAYPTFMLSNIVDYLGFLNKHKVLDFEKF